TKSNERSAELRSCSTAQLCATAAVMPGAPVHAARGAAASGASIDDIIADARAGAKPAVAAPGSAPTGVTHGIAGAPAVAARGANARAAGDSGAIGDATYADGVASPRSSART